MVSTVFSFPAFPVPDRWRDPLRPASATGPATVSGPTRGRFLLDRFYGDDANPLLRRWTDERFLGGQTAVWPLVLYGEPGNGKTVLAEILANHLPGPVRVTTGAEIRRQFHQACATRSVELLRRSWCESPGILVDDFCNVLGPADSRSTGDTALAGFLLSVFDGLAENGRPVIATMTAAPYSSEHLTPALRSRLSAGLSIRVDAPGLAARMALVPPMMEKSGVRISADDLSWLVERLPRSVPAIHGRLSRLSAKIPAASRDQLLDRPTISRWMHSGSERLDPQHFAWLQRAAARQFGVSAADLAGPRRSRSLVCARSAVVWLARNCLGGGYAAIGRLLGGRDGSTVRHASELAERRRTDEPVFGDQLAQLARQLENRLNTC